MSEFYLSRGESRAKAKPSQGGMWTGCVSAKVQIGALLLCKGAKVRNSFQVAGGSPGWQVREGVWGRDVIAITSVRDGR